MLLSVVWTKSGHDFLPDTEADVACFRLRRLLSNQRYILGRNQSLWTLKSRPSIRLNLRSLLTPRVAGVYGIHPTASTIGGA